MEKITIVEGAARHHHFIADCQVAMAFETEGMRLDPETVNLGVGAVLLDPHKGKYFIAKNLEGTPVACLLTIPEWSDWRNGTVLWIHSLYVKPEYRAKGVFYQMYHHLKSMVTFSKDLRGLRLYVDKKNPSAQKVYEKLGMTKEHYDMFEWMK